MSNNKCTSSTYDDICEAGYEYASRLFKDFSGDPEVEQTRECIHESIYESAHHDLEDALESVDRGALKYLDRLDWQEAMDCFSKGIHRLIDEKYPAP